MPRYVVIGNHRLAHHRRGTISMGYLPTKYIRLQFAKDRNPSLQIYGIELKGAKASFLNMYDSMP